MLQGREITVLGAGIAGLALARALALHGAKVTVLEQAEAIREVGAGLQVTPNGMAVLQGLGLGDRLPGIRAAAVELRDGPSGDPVARLDLAGLRGQQTWTFVHRADLVDCLATGAREAGVELRFLQRIERVEKRNSGPILITGQGAELHPGLLLGADGLHSQARVALNGPATPFFTGQAAWRAVIPETATAPAVAEVHMGPGRHLVSYPLRGGQWRNIVAVEERRSWVEESWSLRDDAMELRLAFEGFAPRVQGWLEQVEECWLWGLFRHPVAANWAWTAPDAPDRGMAILGDAAHPTLPFLAQGANMALEDAWTLAEMLAGHEDLATALGLYRQRRLRRVTRVVEAANSNARNYHLRSPLREIAHLGLRTVSRFAPGSLIGRYDWIHGFDVTATQP